MQTRFGKDTFNADMKTMFSHHTYGHSELRKKRQGRGFLSSGRPRRKDAQEKPQSPTDDGKRSCHPSRPLKRCKYGDCCAEAECLDCQPTLKAVYAPVKSEWSETCVSLLDGDSSCYGRLRFENELLHMLLFRCRGTGCGATEDIKETGHWKGNHTGLSSLSEWPHCEWLEETSVPTVRASVDLYTIMCSTLYIFAVIRVPSRKP